jgi:DNA processing protein
MDQSRLSLLALRYISGIGDHLLRQVISYCGSPEQVFKTPRGKLLKIPGIGPVAADAILQGKTFEQAEREWHKATEAGAVLISYLDKAYPSRLRHLPDAPAILYGRGKLSFEHQKIVGIVGTRHATPYGRTCVEELMQELMPHQPLIVSGLAYGIDIHAHKEALRLNLPTVGVLGSGVDIIYPFAHRDIVERMLPTGGVISENSMGVKPDAHHFPARNRIIAGMCDVLVVVEAASSGGALITAGIANSYHKDVFAFPGNVREPYSIGCNHLIKTNQAHLLSSVQDIEYIMNWTREERTGTPAPAVLLAGLTPAHQEVMKCLLESARSLDELTVRMNLPVGQLASILLELECSGKIQALPGKVFKIRS